MGENSKIEWTTHTFNPWTGCTKVSAACDHCYAETWAKRSGKPELWQGERKRTTDKYWQQPLKWDYAARFDRPRVFCASLADVFDNQVPEEWRDQLWLLIKATPNLDWLLLTKRPQNIGKMLPKTTFTGRAWGEGWPNVWLGTTVESPDEYRRIDLLRRVPARIRFLSMEPLLEPCPDVPLDGISWVICGGESGHHARPMHPDWVRSIRDQCFAGSIPFLFKQWGEYGPCELHPPGREQMSVVTLNGTHLKKGEMTYGRDALGAELITHFGKAKAGRLLDGMEHNAFPVAA